LRRIPDKAWSAPWRDSPSRHGNPTELAVAWSPSRSPSRSRLDLETRGRSASRSGAGPMLRLRILSASQPARRCLRTVTQPLPACRTGPFDPWYEARTPELQHPVRESHRSCRRGAS
jgi:hypothetical protein